MTHSYLFSGLYYDLYFHGLVAIYNILAVCKVNIFVLLVIVFYVYLGFYFLYFTHWLFCTFVGL
jgi:hypothetical protein